VNWPKLISSPVQKYNNLNFVVNIKGKTTNFFSPLSFVAVFGSGIRDEKIRIRDKHPRSATLLSSTQRGKCPKCVRDLSSG
jgi:hypothetical protein